MYTKFATRAELPTLTDQVYDRIKYFMGQTFKVQAHYVGGVQLENTPTESYAVRFMWPPRLCVPRPKRPLTGYNLFARDYKASNSGSHSNKTVAAAWKQAQQQPFKERAALLKKDYDVAKNTWDTERRKETVKVEAAAATWPALPDPPTVLRRGTKVRFKPSLDAQLVKDILGAYPGLWALNRTVFTPQRWLEIRNNVYTIARVEKTRVGWPPYDVYYGYYVLHGDNVDHTFLWAPELLEQVQVPPVGGDYAWFVGSAAMSGCYTVVVDTPQKKTTYTKWPSKDVTITLYWNGDVELRMGQTSSVMRGQRDSWPRLVANQPFYATYSNKFLPWLTSILTPTRQRQVFLVSYPKSDTDVNPKSLGDFIWQYDGNYTHGAADWADMNSDQWKEMTTAFLAWQNGGPSILRKTVTATHGSHGSPPTYEYMFQKTTIDRSGSPQFTGMVQKNTATNFPRPIRLVDAAFGAAYLPKSMAAIVRQEAAAVARTTYHQTFPGWPKTELSGQPRPHALRVFEDGQWLGVSSDQVPEMTGRIPAFMTASYAPAVLKELFEWRNLPELVSAKLFVDYFRFNWSRIHAFMDAVLNLKALVGDVKCSIVFHATGMDVIDKIIVSGFQDVGAANGQVCGLGAYNAIYPYVDYTMGNNPTSGLTYIKWNRGFGAVIVSVGVVVPSEFTRNVGGSVRKSGSGIQGTQNDQAVCGGTFLPTRVAPSGSVDRFHREIVYWFDKLKYLCPLGIAIFKQ